MMGVGGERKIGTRNCLLLWENKTDFIYQLGENEGQADQGIGTMDPKTGLRNTDRVMDEMLILQIL